MSDLPEQDDPAPESPPGTEAAAEAPPADEAVPYEEPDDAGYGTAEFHNVVQKQVLNAVYETLIETKLHWELVEPFLDSARQICRGDFRRTGRVEVHGSVADGETWSDAEEAYLSLSIADQDDGREWLSETWWISDLVLAGGDPERAREAARALERSVARLDAWLAEHEKGPGESGS